MAVLWRQHVDWHLMQCDASSPFRRALVRGDRVEEEVAGKTLKHTSCVTALPGAVDGQSPVDFKARRDEGIDRAAGLVRRDEEVDVHVMGTAGRSEEAVRNGATDGVGNLGGLERLREVNGGFSRVHRPGTVEPAFATARVTLRSAVPGPPAPSLRQAVR